MNQTFTNLRTSPDFKSSDGLADVRHVYRVQDKNANKKQKKMTYFNQRIATEGNDREVEFKRNKKVRNFLFEAHHLSIFGGTSESYSYQNLKVV